MGNTREFTKDFWVLAIDFGTSNTSAAWMDSSGQVRELRLGSTGALMPSVVMAVQSGLVVGETAARSALVDPSAFEPVPKRRIADGQVSLGGQSFAATDLVSAVLADVVARAERVAGSPPGRVILTHPDRWGTDLQGLLWQAGIRAGIDGTRLILLSEARAAAWFYTERSGELGVGQRLAVFDFGAGTCDVAVLEKLRDGSFSVVVAEGVDGLGGRDLDARLWGWVRGELARSHPQLLAELETRDGLRRRLTLMDRVREAKEVLSGMSMASIVVPGREQDVVLTLTRSEFEALIRSDVEQSIILVKQVLHLAGDPRPERMYLTGGSSLIPLVHAELAKVTPVGELGDPQTVVSHGALLAPQVSLAQASRIQSTPSPPAPSQATRSQDVPKRRGKALALAVGAAVVVAVLAGFAVLGLTGSKPPTGDSKTTTAIPPGVNSTTQPPATTIAPVPVGCRGLSTAECDLFGTLSQPLRAIYTCDSGSAAGRTAIKCSRPMQEAANPAKLEVAKATSMADMTAWTESEFNSCLEYTPLSPTFPDPSSRTEWKTPELVVGGEMLSCMRRVDGQTLVWTVNSDLTMISASTLGLTAAQMVDWWSINSAVS